MAYETEPYHNASVIPHNVWVRKLTKKLYFLPIQKKNKPCWAIKQIKDLNSVIFMKFWQLSEQKKR